MKTVYANLSRLSNVINNDVVRKIVYYELVTKTKAIDTKISSTSGLVTKTQYDLDKQSLEKKTEDVEKTLILISWSRTLIATQKRIEIEIENKIHSVTG